jgi:hypothetical protein
MSAADFRLVLLDEAERLETLVRPKRLGLRQSGVRQAVRVAVSERHADTMGPQNEGATVSASAEHVCVSRVKNETRKAARSVRSALLLAAMSEGHVTFDVIATALEVAKDVAWEAFRGKAPLDLGDLLLALARVPEFRYPALRRLLPLIAELVTVELFLAVCVEELGRDAIMAAIQRAGGLGR